VADLGETFDGSTIDMGIGGNYASAPADPIRAPMDGRAIFANMASRFDSAPLSPSAAMLDGLAQGGARGETFDGSTIDRGPPSALEELRTHRQWVAWRLLTRPGATKPTKPPVNPHNGLGASHSDPKTWGTFEQADACAKRRKFAGVGFVLSEDDDYTGIDLDHCRDKETGKLDLWAEDIVALGETYWEVSPSGTGLRAIVRGKIANTVKCDTAHVEVYRSQRYLTITQNHIPDTPEDIRPAPTTLEWLLARVAQFAPKEIEPTYVQNLHICPDQVERRPHNDAGERAYAQTALDGNAAELAAGGAGGRNILLNDKAYRMGRMVGAGWIEKSRVEAALTDACHANGYVKDKGLKATRDTLASGLRSGMAKPCADLPDARAEDETRLRALGDETARMLIENENCLQQDNGPRPDGAPLAAQIVDPLAGFIFHGDAPTKPSPALIKGLLQRDGICILGGQSGAGKTFVALYMSTALASGTLFFDHKVVERVGVVILAAEGENTIANRIAVASAQNEAGEILPIAWLGSIPDLSKPAEIRTMIVRLRAVDQKMRAQHGVRLGAIIIDTLAAAFNLKDENDNAEANRVISCMNMLAKGVDAVVIPVHHYGKAAETGLRGASAWFGGADAVLSVLAKRDHTTGKCSNRQLALAKTRVGEEGWIAPFDLRFVELGEDEDGEAYGACYVEPGEADGGDIITMSKPKALPRAARAYIDALQIVVGEKGKKVRPFGSDGAEVTAVDRELVRDEFYLAWPADGDDEKARKGVKCKAFGRGEAEALTRRQVYSYEVGGEHLVWLLSESAL